MSALSRDVREHCNQSIITMAVNTGVSMAVVRAFESEGPAAVRNRKDRARLVAAYDRLAQLIAFGSAVTR